MELFKVAKGKRVRLSASEQSQVLSDRAAAIDARDARTEHLVELKIGTRTLTTTFMDNLNPAEITAIEAAGYTVTLI